jgi:DNA-3-methyladenine glycosylase I
MSPVVKRAPREKPRCAWPKSTNLLYVRYHDTEWGVPEHDDRALFEKLILDGAQAGLSWETILNKREGYRKAFEGFVPAKVARFDARKVEKLLQDPGIVRNRLKIESAIGNAKAFLELQDSEASFDRWLWSFVDGAPLQNRWDGTGRIPASTKVSDAISKELKRRGFRFVGTTIVYAYMQAIGMVNDHLVTCFRHSECARLGRARRR